MVSRDGNGRENTILDAARKRFAYYGFTKVTMDEIAADAGMAKPSLYRYYPTKDSIYKAVVAREHRRFHDEIEKFIEKKDSASLKLRKYANLRVRLFREFVNLNPLETLSSGMANPLPDEAIQALHRQESACLERILLEGDLQREFSVERPQDAATLVFHLLQGLRLRVLRQATGPGIQPADFERLERETDQCIDLILDGIRNHS
jgi:TetR/AcrR family transcriptional repressor of mexJK operon